MPNPTTALQAPPLVPEISLHLVREPVGLFDLTGGEFHSDEPPPFWAFAWAGGQALARYLLDHPEEVAGRRVHDLGTGCGIAAIAAAIAGATEVVAADTDPGALAAAQRNAAANHVTISTTADPAAGRADLILAGDVFYSPTVAPAMVGLLRDARRQSADVLVGDPGRGYFPERLFAPVAEYVVPVSAALEEAEALTTRVWRMR